MNREELQKTSNELIQAARSNDLTRVIELIGDVFEGGRVAGIEEALELAEDAFGNGESDQLANNLRALLEAGT